MSEAVAYGSPDFQPTENMHAGPSGKLVGQGNKTPRCYLSMQGRAGQASRSSSRLQVCIINGLAVYFIKSAGLDSMYMHSFTSTSSILPMFAASEFIKLQAEFSWLHIHCCRCYLPFSFPLKMRRAKYRHVCNM